MQLEALKVADLDQESEATKKLYGVDAEGRPARSASCV